jgi:glycosyltransferase involved in cell wall biosynthesis
MTSAALRRPGVRRPWSRRAPRAIPGDPEGARPLLLHVTTVDMSLELLLGPQLRAFRDAGYDVFGVSAPGRYTAGLKADGIGHRPLRHATRAFSLGSDLLAFWELWRLFRTVRPDIVHTHNPKPGVFGRVAARLARVPLVVNTQHGLYAQPGDRWRRKLACYALERVAASFSDVELIQNEEDLATLRRLGVPATKLVLLGNGVDLNRFDPHRYGPDVRAWARNEVGADSPSQVVVGCVARLVAEKGIPELIDAAEAVLDQETAVRFVVIGPFEHPQETSVAQALRRGEDIGVRFLGPRDDVERLYTGLDLFVLPSHREGFPRSVMEAAAMGLPTVGTRIRGMRQAIAEPATGVLVPARNAGALADAILQLLRNPEQLREMGHNAREYALQHFDMTAQVAITLGAYHHGRGGTAGPGDGDARSVAAVPRERAPLGRAG